MSLRFYVPWFEVRDSCSFYCYWWNCNGPSPLKLSLDNETKSIWHIGIN
jgi:hypothetical protein